MISKKTRKVHNNEEFKKTKGATAKLSVDLMGSCYGRTWKMKDCEVSLTGAQLAAKWVAF